MASTFCSALIFLCIACIGDMQLSMMLPKCPSYTSVLFLFAVVVVRRGALINLQDTQTEVQA